MGKNQNGDRPRSIQKDYSIRLREFHPLMIEKEGRPRARFHSRVRTLTIHKADAWLNRITRDNLDFIEKRLRKKIRSLGAQAPLTRESLEVAFEAGQLLTLIRLRQGEILDLLRKDRREKIKQKKGRQLSAQKRNELWEWAQARLNDMYSENPKLTLNEMISHLQPELEQRAGREFSKGTMQNHLRHPKNLRASLVRTT